MKCGVQVGQGYSISKENCALSGFYIESKLIWKTNYLIPFQNNFYSKLLSANFTHWSGKCAAINNVAKVVKLKRSITKSAESCRFWDLDRRFIRWDYLKNNLLELALHDSLLSQSKTGGKIVGSSSIAIDDDQQRSLLVHDWQNGWPINAGMKYTLTRQTPASTAYRASYEWPCV